MAKVAKAPTTLPSAGVIETGPTELASNPFPMTTRAMPRDRGAKTKQRWLVPGLVALAAAASVSLFYFLRAQPLRPTVSPPPSPSAPAPVSKDGKPCPPEMAFIKGAVFPMGSDSGEPDEKPVHQVTVSAFCIDRRELSRADYSKCTVCKEAYASPEGAPVVGVDYVSASAACEAIGKRLPTEAEWELAARGAEGRLYPWGNESITCDRAAVARAGNVECRGGIWPSGAHSIGATPDGVEDMAGNVWEWVADIYGVYPTSPTIDPTGPPNGSLRVVRGGSWSQGGLTARATNRVALGKNERLSDTGVRCAKMAAR